MTAAGARVGAGAERTARQAEMLAGRLRKRARHLRKWARREAVTCYRVYDRDIPEIPLVIDWYEGKVSMARYRRRDDSARSGDGDGSDGDDGADWAAWTRAMADATRDALGAERVYIKERRRQRGSAQYSRLDERGERAIVREGGLSFAVNLGDYLDTGLFLDHRITRARLRDEAAGKRFLNLFCYTGAFTVYAAAGGASETVSVDLSRTYLSWARDNMLHNGFGGGAHRFVHQDVRVFLTEGRARAQRFDLIALDPPSFSNSKDMDGVLDVRRDHPALIRDAAALLAPGGALYFSTNRRGFQLNEATVAAVAADAADVAPEGLAVEDITRATTPPDFERRPPHRCWRIARG